MDTPHNIAFNDWLAYRLKQPLPGMRAQEKMAGRVLPMPEEIPADARSSAVLALLFPKEDLLNLLLIQRSVDGGAHSGQISFPGGRYELSDSSLEYTALRETNEEVGVDTASVSVLGALSRIYIPVSNFNVFPYVGFTPQKPNPYTLSRDEVADVLEIPLVQLFDPAHKTTADVRPSSRPGMLLRVPAYQLPDGPMIWGATAMILSELETVFEEYLNDYK
ncbi:NUDIX hydrolase [Chitinophagaceae bacterium MMS25-I14]